MITRFRVSNFRGIREADLRLGPFTVLIGPNGAGKSNLLEAIHFFLRILESPLSEVLSEFGGTPYLVNASGGGDRIDFEVEIVEGLGEGASVTVFTNVGLQVDGMHGTLAKVAEDYRIALTAPSGRTHAVEVRFDLLKSTYTLVDGERVSNLWEGEESGAEGSDIGEDMPQVVLPGRSMASENSSKLLPALNGLGELPRRRSTGNSIVKLACSLLGIAAGSASFPRAADWLGNPQVRLPKTVRDWQGQDFLHTELTSYLSWMWNEEGAGERKREMEQLLAAAVPRYKGIRFKPAGEGSHQLHMDFTGLEKSIPCNRLSDGIISILCLGGHASRGPEGLLAIEEPEVGLHPAVHGLVVEHLRSVSVRQQVIITTHSTSLVRGLEPEEVVVADLATKDGGTSPVFWRLADLDGLHKWLEEYDLGSLWGMGLLGAKP